MKQGDFAGDRQRGLSLTMFLLGIIVVGLLAVVGMKVVPTVVEFMAIKKAIVNAKNAGASAREIQDSFDKQRQTNYVESITGKDLEIIRSADGWDVNVAYQKKIELFGPVSLVIDYEATTASGTPKKTQP